MIKIDETRIRPRIFPLLLVPLGLLVYLKALQAPFVYDDRMYITDNPAIRSLGGFAELSGTRYIGFLSFAVNYALSGLTAFDFHLTNIVIHIVNAVLVYLLVEAIFRTPAMRGRGGVVEADAGAAAAAFVSLLFLTHPVQTQAVSYVSQRFTSLAALFYLGSILLYLRGRLLFEAGAQRRAWLACGVSLAAALAAMKTKEISFTLPFAAAMVEFLFFPGRREGTAGPRPRLMLLPHFALLPVIPLTLLAGGSAGGDVAVELRRLQLTEAATLSRGLYLLTELSVVVTYLRLLFFPVNQHIDYDYPISRSLLEPATLASLLLLSALAASALLALLRSRRGKAGPPALLYAFGVFWFFLTLAVESSVVPIQDVIFEHRVYLPSVGAVAAFAGVLLGAHRLLRFRGLLLKTAAPVFLVATAVVLAVPLSAATWKRNTLWCDEVALISDAIGKSPGKARLYYARGLAFLDRGMAEAALSDFDRAAALGLDAADLYNNRAIARAGVGEIEGALDDFSRAVERDPGLARARFNRALTLARLGRGGEALAELARYIRLTDPATARASLTAREVRRDVSALAAECSAVDKEGCAELTALLGAGGVGGGRP